MLCHDFDSWLVNLPLRLPAWNIVAMISDIWVLACRSALSLSVVRRSAKQVANWIAKFCRAFGSWSYNSNSVSPRLEALVSFNFAAIL